jgi:5-methylcytosine-specific restriction endonuclease McrA
VRFRSKKREALYRKRRPLVEQLLAEFPICQRCGTNPSRDIHEVVTRARGGSILDPANLRALCRSCHIWITTHPKQAEAEGLMAPSWERDRYTTDVEGRPE